MSEVTAQAEGRAFKLHGLLVPALPLLLAATPWILMVRQWRAQPGWGDWLHLMLGLLVFFATAALALGGWQRRRWALWLPPFNAAGRRRLGEDLGRLARGRIPSSEAGGLFAFFEGLLLLAVMAAGASGLAWLLAQGGDTALVLGEWHRWCGITAGVLFALHFLAVALHLRDFF